MVGFSEGVGMGVTSPLPQLLTATPTTGGSFVRQRAEGIDTVQAAAFLGATFFFGRQSVK